MLQDMVKVKFGNIKKLSQVKKSSMGVLKGQVHFLFTFVSFSNVRRQGYGILSLNVIMTKVKVKF